MRTPRRRRPGLLSEPGRGFCQYLPLFTQHPYLAAQPIEYFALGRGQAVAAQSFIESSLLDPLADRLNCRFEFTRQRGDAAPAARQFNDSTSVFCCVWWMRSGHLENSFSYTLYETGSTSLVADALAGHLALGLGEGEQHVKRQPPHRGGGIEP